MTVKQGSTLKILVPQLVSPVVLGNLVLTLEQQVRTPAVSVEQDPTQMLPLLPLAVSAVLGNLALQLEQQVLQLVRLAQLERQASLLALPTVLFANPALLASSPPQQLAHPTVKLALQEGTAPRLKQQTSRRAQLVMQASLAS